ncbi:hypothetical protein FA09DRAFT_334097 [Tilletiopsis washingtonensis]|uniref:t-SNARE coiled-coil homology domain-containing protein n=1 Tax=Tilletiopsis washingtonensis TaxID=58919 RepID=A0A316Z9T4_9BASI|nr:hypothetical protein FA09DRAFT_334097 [Tilletiopsis washingtonensis]PWN98460.1 hypothetical protein FA09DRAFT_334097 [Tilletiopsis washingtonensis]
MSSDPYHTFAADLRKALASASERASALSRARSSGAARDAQRNAHDELLDALEALQADIEDVRQSVVVVARTPERFGVEHAELERRRAFVKECEEEWQRLSRAAGSRPSMGARGADMEEGAAEDDDVEAFEREQQQLSFAGSILQSLLAKQDSTLSMIGRSITTLRDQASTMGHEIAEQVELVTTFDTEVEQSQSRLKRAMGRMDELARRSDERCGGWRSSSSCSSSSSSSSDHGPRAAAARLAKRFVSA